MGSFYSSCSVTGDTIKDGDKMVRLLLVPSAHYDGYSSVVEYSNQTQLYVSNNGSQGIYSPFGFPVIGEYNDYGDIANIVEDYNTELLKELFGVEVESLYRLISEGEFKEDQKNLELLKSLKYTDINYKVYKKLTEIKDFWHIDYVEENINKFFNYKSKYLDLPEKLKKALERINKPKTFIPSLCKHDMFSYYSKDVIPREDYTSLYIFLINLSRMNKLLQISNYGGQDDNTKLLKTIYSQI